MAHCRLNLGLLYGLEIADAFLAAYLRRRPAFRVQRYWELDAIVGTGVPVWHAPWRAFAVPEPSSAELHARLTTLLDRALTIAGRAPG